MSPCQFLHWDSLNNSPDGHFGDYLSAEPCWDPICHQYKLGYFMLKMTEKYNISWLKDERELLDQ